VKVQENFEVSRTFHPLISREKFELFTLPTKGPKDSRREKRHEERNGFWGKLQATGPLFVFENICQSAFLLDDELVRSFLPPCDAVTRATALEARCKRELGSDETPLGF
jgi:hypothetical protein